VKNFRNIVVVDFEFEAGDGALPVPLCMVAYVLDSNLRHVRTIRRWRGEFGPKPPFDIGSDTLFVGYSAWAEMQCFIQLGWQFPTHIFDQHTAYLAASNILYPYDDVRKNQRKRLSDACKSYLIPGWERIDKEVISKAIGEGHWRDYGQPATYEYCEEDVRASTALFHKQLQGFERYQPASVMHQLHLGKLQRQSGRTDPSLRHADRYAAVESGAREQDSSHQLSTTGV
jgi:DNA polymerase I